MTFFAQDFEVFLRKFQYKQPMIHILYPGVIEMIRIIRTKFVRKKYLLTDQGTSKPDEDLLKVNVLSKKICNLPIKWKLERLQRDFWEVIIF